MKRLVRARMVLGRGRDQAVSFVSECGGGGAEKEENSGTQ